MMMKRKYGWFVLVVMMLSMPLIAYSQCADIFKQGVAMMEAKKYKSAISYFEKAKKCDKNLAKQCDEKIYECRRLINPIKKDPVKSSVITLDKEILEFGSEETSARTVKVTSEIEWTCTTDANWCTMTKMDGKVAIACKINQTADERKADIRVDNGKETKHITVIQKGVGVIFDIIPEQLDVEKEGGILEIELECNIDYVIEYIPEWIKVRHQNHNMMIIKVDAYEFSKKESKRDDVLVVKTPNGESDHVEIIQWKKRPKDEKTGGKDSGENIKADKESMNGKRPKNLKEYRNIKKRK